MFNFQQLEIVAVAGCLALTSVGCQPKTDEKPENTRPVMVDPWANDQRTQPADAAYKPKTAEPLPPPTIPEVALSDALRATCLVNVGDTLPETKLVGLDDNLHALDSLYGPKLTVVCFWTIGTTRRAQLTATATLKDLTNQVDELFRQKGVRVVGINVGDPAEDVNEYADQAKATFPILLDPKGEYFVKIAKDRKMPRIYLLDAQGEILWFDVEFSRSARQDLAQGIRVALEELE